MTTNKPRTIEQHYSDLRNAREELREEIGSLTNIVPCRRVRERIAARATALSVHRWDRVRQHLAKERVAMPLEPVTFDLTGYSCGPVCSNRVLACQLEQDILDEAVILVRAELEAELVEAERAFEAYAELVAQGVALAPSEG